MAEASGPQLTWTNVVATIAVICVIAGGGYKIVESQFDYVRQSSDASFLDISKQIQENRADIKNIRDGYLTLREHNSFKQALDDSLVAVGSRLTVLETEQRELLGHSAHSPVEAKEVDQLSISVDKRFELIQQQINDINRQIAASILQNGIPAQRPPLVQGQSK